MKKILMRTFNLVSLVWIAWVAFSYIEVISKNLSPNPHYSFLNLFSLIFG